MENLPIAVDLLFGATTLVTVYLFYRATHYSNWVLSVLVIWMLFQAGLGLAEFYTVTDGIPPRFALQALPALLLIIGLMTTNRGKQFVDSLDVRELTMLHTIRVFVEIALWWLFLEATLPEMMTFEGRNFDVLAGLTAPLIVYFGYVRKQLSRNAILIWNFLSLGLLINIIIIGILSLPSPFQQLNFGQPNIALIYFPYVWLASTVVPIVILAHLAAIRQTLQLSTQPIQPYEVRHEN